MRPGKWRARALLVVITLLIPAVALGGVRGTGPPAAQAPVASIAPQPATECIGGRGEVVLDGSGSFDPDGDSMTFRWTVPGGAAEDPEAPITRASIPFGVTEVTLTVSDGSLSTTAKGAFRVVDTVRPTVAQTRPVEGMAYFEDEEAFNYGNYGLTHADLRAILVGALAFEADASDMCGLSKVQFSWDNGIHFWGVQGPPYRMMWEALLPDNHRFVVGAEDRGGNWVQTLEFKFLQVSTPSLDCLGNLPQCTSGILPICVGGVPHHFAWFCIPP